MSGMQVATAAMTKSNERPLWAAHEGNPIYPDFDGFGDYQCILELDAKILTVLAIFV